MTKTQTAVANKNINMSLIAILAGWSLTILTLVWQVAIKDATYTSRLDFIEGELTAVDERLDTAEEFRLNISSDLAEIKTDLMWIRKQLQENASNIQAIRNEDRN
jgi:septal ring factor EnvC (AmiA/AmiB activator)